MYSRVTTKAFKYFVKKISDTMLITGILLYCPEYGLSKDTDLSQPCFQAFTPFVTCNTQAFAMSVICSMKFTQAFAVSVDCSTKIHTDFCIASDKYHKGLGKRLHSTPITHRQSYDAGFSHFSRLFMFCASLSIGKLETKRGLGMRLRALWKTFVQIITGTGDHC